MMEASKGNAAFLIYCHAVVGSQYDLIVELTLESMV